VTRRHVAALVAIGVLGAACTEQIQSTSGPVTPTVVTSIVDETTVPSSTAPPSSGAATTTSTSTSTTSTTSTSSTSTTSTTVVPTTTSCRQIVHIGDSTSVSLFEPSSVGGADLTATAQYQRVGVVDVYPDNDGARSMVESVIGGDPVLWVDAVTQRTEDAYRNASMVAWNQELYRITAEYSNVRVYRWYDVVRPEWFRNDGIHYTVEGTAQRAALTAQALVTFFPATA